MENSDINNIKLFNFYINKILSGESYNLIKMVIFLQEVWHRKGWTHKPPVGWWGISLSLMVKSTVTTMALHNQVTSDRSLLARPHITSLEASLLPWGIVSSIFHPRRNTTLAARPQSPPGASASRGMEDPWACEAFSWSTEAWVTAHTCPQVQSGGKLEAAGMEPLFPSQEASIFQTRKST